jgi:hypothetical protein
MNRQRLNILRFARRQSHGVALVVRRAAALGVSFAFALVPAASGLLPAAAEAKALPARPQPEPDSASQCRLESAGGAIKHVVYIQFDNVHFTRDIPNVPSDLEQMPHLLNFIKGQGTLLANHHTPLISHTANDILTSLTGVYPDRHGVPVANSFRYFNPGGTSNLGVSFAYWTDPIFDPTTSTATDTKFNMLTAEGKNAPAPWVPFTRAGCNFGSVSLANIELENIGTDIPTVFGANSPQAQEVATNPDQATADFVGVAIHCAAGNATCSAANGGLPDVLPDEPNGYTGFNALFGHQPIAPVISPGGPLTDLNGTVISDGNGHIGFPGFGGISAAQTLSYLAAMQEHGVSVTYGYISDAHADHANNDFAYGPGQAGYVAQLASYDDAFHKFLTRLASDGINQRNTLFIFTADEGDHFIGGTPTPANCDGVTIACTYPQIGELSANLTGLLATQQNITTPFKLHSDSAPAIYITGNPARTDPVTRAFSQGLNKLTAVNPITNNTDQLTKFLADPVEMNMLHMITSDPARTPTMIMFADPNYFLFGGAPNCKFACVTENPAFAWNHGDVQPEIVTTWLGMVGPGVKEGGVDHRTWSDHTDIRPTMLLLLGLQDDYEHQGRALVEKIHRWALPGAVRDSGDDFAELASAYKRINAPVGELGLASLKISTAALAGDDATYNILETQLQWITTERDALAARMFDRLSDAEFGGKHVSHGEALTMVRQANALVELVNTLAAQVAGQ